MPAQSKAQQQAAAIAEHHPEKAKGAAKEMAKGMSKKQLHHFAATDTKELPEHKEAAQGFVDGYKQKQAGVLDASINQGVQGAAMGAPIGAVANQMGAMNPEEEKAGRKNRIKRALMGALAGGAAGAGAGALSAAAGAVR